MKMTYRKFALLVFLFSISYHAVWMFVASAVAGNMRLPSSVHITLLYVLPIVLLLCISIWLRLWDFTDFKKFLSLTLLILIIPGIALQLIALFACQLQGECF